MDYPATVRVQVASVCHRRSLADSLRHVVTSFRAHVHTVKSKRGERSSSSSSCDVIGACRYQYRRPIRIAHGYQHPIVTFVLDVWSSNSSDFDRCNSVEQFLTESVFGDPEPMIGCKMLEDCYNNNHSRHFTHFLNFYAPGNEVPVGQKIIITSHRSRFLSFCICVN